MVDLGIFSGPGDQFVTITFDDKGEACFGFESGILRFIPDAKTCAFYLFDVVVFNHHKWIAIGCHETVVVTVGDLEITFDVPKCQFSANWKGTDPPAEFLAFQQEFNKVRDRLLNLKAFW
jgi:hypothetical protein